MTRVFEFDISKIIVGSYGRIELKSSARFRAKNSIVCLGEADSRTSFRLEPKIFKASLAYNCSVKFVVFAFARYDFKSYSILSTT